MCTDGAGERANGCRGGAGLLRGRTARLARQTAPPSAASPALLPAHPASERPGGWGSRVRGGQSLEPGLRGPAAAGRGEPGGQLLQLSHLNELMNCYFVFHPISITKKYLLLLSSEM